MWACDLTIACVWLFNCPSQPQNKASRQIMFSHSSSGGNLLFHHCRGNRSQCILVTLKRGKRGGLFPPPLPPPPPFYLMKLLYPAISAWTTCIKQWELLSASLTFPMAATTACCNPRMSLFCLQKWATSCRNTADYQNLVISNLNCYMVFKQDFSSTQRSKTRILNRQKWSPNTKGILWLNKYNNNAL